MAVDPVLHGHTHPTFFKFQCVLMQSSADSASAEYKSLYECTMLQTRLCVHPSGAQGLSACKHLHNSKLAIGASRTSNGSICVVHLPDVRRQLMTQARRVTADQRCGAPGHPVRCKAWPDFVYYTVLRRRRQLEVLTIDTEVLAVSRFLAFISFNVGKLSGRSAL
jgi:hypothetical protein